MRAPLGNLLSAAHLQVMPHENYLLGYYFLIHRFLPHVRFQLMPDRKSWQHLDTGGTNHHCGS